MTYNIDELTVFLKENNIPVIKKNETTFLEISGQPHYENVISNIYAFFLNPYEKHKLDELFISSLLHLIEKKVVINNLQKQISFSNDFEIEREKGTEGRKRIDLLITDNENVIIIESKIYHELNNPLGTYWNSKRLPKVSDEKKIGIILTLWQQNSNNKNYINITHIEWLDEIFEHIKPYKEENKDNKFIVFLEDLYQNIKNLTNKMKEKEIEFYKNNVSKVNKAVDLKFAIRNHIINEVERACGLLDKKLSLDKISRHKYNQKRLRYYRSKKDKNLVITVVFEKLLNEKGELYIIVELQHKSIKTIQKKYDEITKDLEETQTLKLNNTFEKTNKNYAHFAHISDCKPNAKEIENLSLYIVQKIKNNNILQIFNRLEDNL